MVYLIYFDSPLGHARHYLGFCDDLEKRITRHKSGSGAKILAECKRVGID